MCTSPLFAYLVTACMDDPLPMTAIGRGRLLTRAPEPYQEHGRRRQDLELLEAIERLPHEHTLGHRHPCACGAAAESGGGRGTRLGSCTLPTAPGRRSPHGSAYADRNPVRCSCRWTRRGAACSPGSPPGPPSTASP